MRRKKCSPEEMATSTCHAKPHTICFQSIHTFVHTCIYVCTCGKQHTSSLCCLCRPLTINRKQKLDNKSLPLARMSQAKSRGI
ncbi:unnamed protein product [Periconia digitata]|uniref:Uncharacterized protein n=1 Tax=Periconia digitata TaxID=1303443 RepID=A0A9W4XN11_9PLEO|nr:unnamed protein product [Periconia digitata]